jgi:hypothetical protein
MAAAHSNAVSTANTKRAGGFRLGLIGVNADVALVSLLTAFKRASHLINGEFMGSCSFQTEGREQGATWGLAFCPSASSLNAEFSRGVRKKKERWLGARDFFLPLTGLKRRLAVP